jgi:predicted transcriptional regulator
MGTIEDVKLKILSFLMEIKEANAKQLEEIAECANKTFLKARQQLEKEGLIQKRYQNRKEGGLEAIYSIPQEKLQSVKIMLDKKNLNKDAQRLINSANTQKDIEFYKKKFDELEKELKHYKRVARIRELELKLLPADIIQSKIKELGINDDEFWRQSESIVWYWPGINHGVKSDDIILKLSREPLPPKLSDDGDIDYYQGWKLLGYVPSKKLYVYAIYKELLELYKEHLKETYTSLKKEFCLNDDEWKNLSPKIYEMIENGSFMREIRRYLFNYILSLNSIDKLKNLYMKHGISEKLAERWARETIEEAQHAKAEN